MNQSVGRRLALERHRLQRTQAEVAAIGSIAVPTQVVYEQGTRTPATEYLCRLRPAGFDVWYLLFGETSADLAADVIDWQLLGKIAAAIQEWCVSRKVEIQPDKYPEVLRLVYNDYRHKPGSNSAPIDIDRTLRVVA